MANPLTCLHRVIGPAFDGNTQEFFLFCLSCDTHLEEKHLKSRLFEYETNSRVWVYKATLEVIKGAAV